jgi:hypothetical protein
MYEESRVAVLCCVETIEPVCVNDEDVSYLVSLASPPLVSKQTIPDRVMCFDLFPYRTRCLVLVLVLVSSFPNPPNSTITSSGASRFRSLATDQHDTVSTLRFRGSRVLSTGVHSRNALLTQPEIRIERAYCAPTHQIRLLVVVEWM